MSESPRYTVTTGGYHWIAARDGQTIATWDGTADPRKPGGILDQVAACVPVPLGATVRWLPNRFGWTATTDPAAYALVDAVAGVDALVAQVNAAAKAAEEAPRIEPDGGEPATDTPPGKATIKLTVDPSDLPELIAALNAAREHTRRMQVECPLRSQDPETRRYAWARVGTALLDATEETTR